MLHTFEYYIFEEWDKVLKKWCKAKCLVCLASSFLHVGVCWGCVHGNIYNKTKAQLPPDMSKICQSMSF